MNLKTLALAVLAAISLLTAVGAGTASATVLCKTTSTPCAEKYGSGTTLQIQLKEGTSAKFKSMWATIECGTTAGSGTISNAGGATATATIELDTWSASECTCAGGPGHVTTKNLGWLEVHNISGEDSGTVTGSETNMTVNCTALGTQCNFGTTNQIHLGKLTGGASPLFEAGGTVLPRIAEDGSIFICGTTGTWTAEYEVTAPKPLYIEPS